jgi:hypothetical protein
VFFSGRLAIAAIFLMQVTPRDRLRNGRHVSTIEAAGKLGQARHFSTRI